MEEKNIMKIEKSYITPEDSLCIYGIAILMMVWHQFFWISRKISWKFTVFWWKF